MKINLNATPEDQKLIDEITLRAIQLGDFDALTINMDLTATHLNGTPLKLAELLTFPKIDFMHDIYGINRHLNRETGEMMDCFLPRCAA